MPGRKVVLAGIAVGILVTLAAYALRTTFPSVAYTIERGIVDLHVRHSGERPATQHPGIAVVTITEETLAPLRYRDPIDRGFMADLVKAIDRAGARSIGLNFYYLKPTTPEKDEALITAIREARAHVVMGGVDGRNRDTTAAQRDYQELFVFGQTMRSTGYLELRVESDGVVRFWAQPFAGGWLAESFSVQLARTVGAARLPAYPMIAWRRPPSDGSDTFLTLPAHAVVATAGSTRSSELSALRGRIVLIGVDLQDRDRHRTPLPVASVDGRMPGVLVHAHTLAQLLDRREFTILPAWREFALIFSRVLFGFFVGCRRRHARSDLMAGGWGAVSLLAFDSIMFATFRTIIPLTMLFVAWVIGIGAGHVAWARRTGNAPASMA